MRFELTQAEPKGLAVLPLNHSGTSSFHLHVGGLTICKLRRKSNKKYLKQRAAVINRAVYCKKLFSLQMKFSEKWNIQHF